MTKRLWIFSLLIVVAPLPTLAASGSFITESDLDHWSDISTETQTDIDTMSTEMQFQNQTELFPAESGTGAVQEEEFVSVRVDGKLLVFRDVPVREWFAPYVRTIAELGIISGYRDAAGVPLGTFGPGDSVTLEQVTKVLLYGTEKDPSACTGTLLNQAVSAWAHSFILCAEQLQWSVFSDGSVQVQRNATRAEVIATVLQAFDVQTENTSGDVFSDVGSSTLYAAAIERAQKDGIVSGYSNADGTPKGIFGPDDPVKRAEFAKMVTIALEVYGTK